MSGGGDRTEETWFPEEDALRDEPAPARCIGRYVLWGELGRGGMGVVYAAWDPKLRRELALKVLLGAPHAGAASRERFLREARTVARLDHPAVVRVYDIGEHEGCVFFAMDLVRGGTLAMLDREALGLRGLIELLVRIARGVAAAHSAGLVHRDIKPGNILLDEDGEPRITDFGLAVDARSFEDRLTRHGQVMGTPTYMAPEQAAGEVDRISPRTDVYALGVLCYELLTGVLPYDGTDPSAVLSQMEAGPLPSIRRARPELPAELERVVQKAMSLEIDGRYPDAGALADDLERFLRGEPVIAAPISLIRRTRWAIRRARRYAAGAAAGVAAALGLVGGAWGLHQWRAERVAALRAEAAALRWEQVAGRLASLEEAGDYEAADRVFEDFAGLPEVAGTPALGRAWIARAGLLEDRGELEAAADALARAYLAVEDLAVQREALLALGWYFTEREQWAALSAVIDTLGRRQELGLGFSELLDLRIAEAQGRGDLARAAALRSGRGGSAAAALSELSVGTRLDGVLPAGAIWRPWDIDGDGRPEIARQLGDGPIEVFRIAPPSREPALVIPADQARLAGWYSTPRGPDYSHLLVERAGAWALLTARDEAPGWSVDPISGLDYPGWFTRDLGTIDSDGDGEGEVYIASNRTLYRLRPGAEGWVAEQPHRAMGLAGSDVMSAIRADLDGDGEAELAVAAAEWGALDVRVFRPGEDFELLTRAPLGEVYGLERVGGGRLAALVRRKYTGGLDLWEGDEGFDGLAILEMREGRLEVVERYPFDADGKEGLIAGDLDGDGREDLVAFMPDPSVLFVSGEGGFEPIRQGALQLLMPLELDGDPASEWLATSYLDGSAWLIGVGDEPLPEPASLRPPPLSVPELDEGLWEGTWRRAEDLVALGMIGPAARELERGDVASGALALSRAAELYDESGDYRRAASLAVRIAEDEEEPGPRDALLDRAQASLERALLWDRELEIIRRRLGQGASDPALRARRDVLDAALSGLRLDFDRPLEPPLQIEAPQVVSRRPQDGSLLLRPGISRLVSLPIHWDGGLLGMSVALSVTDAEWGDELRFLLAGEDGAVYPLLRVDVFGGAGRSRLEYSSVNGQIRALTPLREGVVSWSGELEVALDVAGRRLRVTRQEEGHPPEDIIFSLESASLPEEPGTYRLELGSVPGCGGARFALGHLALTGGVRLADAPPSARDRAALRLAEGWPEEAGELLGDAAGPEAELLRMLIADATGRERAVTGLLGRLLAEGYEDQLLPLLRTSPGRYASRLEELRGSRWLLDFWDVWGCSAGAHPEEEPVHIALTERLRSLDDAAIADFPRAEERLVIARLARARGRAWERQGQPSLARASYGLGLRWAAAAGSGETAVQAAQLGAGLLVDLAALDLSGGRAERGWRELEEALERSPTPEILSDRLDVDERFEALRSEPRWAALFDASR